MPFSWAIVSWRLRSGGSLDQPRERLLFDRAQLATSRKHGL